MGFDGKNEYTIVFEKLTAHLDEETYKLIRDRMCKPCDKCGALFQGNPLEGLTLKDICATSWNITEERPGVREYGKWARTIATIGAALGIGRIVKEEGTE
jgi:hypothetical protein